METQEEQQAVTILVRVHLTEVQVRTAIVEYLLKDDKLKNTIDGKEVRMHAQWHTNKWSDPDALVHVFFTEVPVDAADDIGANDTGAVSDLTLESSPFAVNSSNPNT